MFMYKLHAKETQEYMWHAMIPKYILTFLPQIIYRYSVCSGLDLAGTEMVKPEVKVTVTWKQLVTRQGIICIYVPNMDLLP